MPSSSIKLLCLGSVLFLLVARFIPVGHIGATDGRAGHPVQSSAQVAQNSAAGNDPYAKLAAIERILPFTKSNLDHFLKYVSDEKALATSPIDQPSTAHVDHEAIDRPSGARHSHQSAGSHTAAPATAPSWTVSLDRVGSQALALYRRMPSIVTSALGGFLLGLIIARPVRRFQSNRNLSASYFAHKPLVATPSRPPRAPSPPAPRSPYGKELPPYRPRAERISEVAGSIRRFIEI